MRIVIDMQGAQSAGSRARGIGRYTMSVSRAMARNRGEHELILALSGLYPETIEPIRAAFDGLLPRENIRIWDAPGPVDYAAAPKWRREIAEQIREYFLAHLKPDVILVSSLFEGFDQNTVTSIDRICREIPTAVILYDLIPYLHRSSYLQDPVLAAWYLEKLDHLRRADLLLSISESSRQEAIRHLGFDEPSVINISTAATEQFSRRNVPPSRIRALMERYALDSPFVMYTGGIDFRKNIEGLIRAFARLPRDIRQQYRLAIVCSAREQDRQHLVSLAVQAGLQKRDLSVTGFIPDEDLVDLYNLCTVFVFPSWHEGFGLPALEAMSCGAPVIGANTSSLPEVIGRDDALFDPHDDEAITAKLLQALTDETFRQALAKHGLEQARRFSWDRTAKRALSTLEQRYQEHEKYQISASGRRPRLAYVSPLPPEPSGISDYSAELLLELSRHYEIDVVVAQQKITDPYIAAAFPICTVEWLRHNARKYDRVLYHFGNSHFHEHMFGLLQELPGVVVLHDFFLSAMIRHLDIHRPLLNVWASELYNSHGYEAVWQRFHAKEPEDIVMRYPCNLTVLQHAQGVIVHSANSLRLAERWHGKDTSSDWALIPLLRARWTGEGKLAARKELGFGVSDFLVCAFGILGPTKLNERLLRAWLKSRLAQDGTCHLVFVGKNHPGDYGREILATIRSNQAEQSVHVTGWVGMDVFRQYLAAADIAVQLRTLSRGETSAAVFDCMNYGLATIVNADGSMADLDEDAVWKLPDEFTDAQLIEALETLWKDAELRNRLGARGQAIIAEEHDPRTCAAQYHEAIERFSVSAARGTRALASAIAGLEYPLDDGALSEIAQSIAGNMPPLIRGRQLLVDISELVQGDPKPSTKHSVRSILKEWLTHPPPGYRIEPVFAAINGGYRYARRFTLSLLDCPDDILPDDPIDYASGDIFFGLNPQPAMIPTQHAFYQELRSRGVRTEFFVHGRQGVAAIASKRQTTPLPRNISWRIEGPFDSTYSLALLNRETARALRDLGHHVVLHSTEGPGDFLPSEGFLRANPDLAELYARSATTFAGDVDVTSRNLYPPRVADMHSRLNLLHHYAWEESGFPADWANDFNNHLDGVTCLSSHVEKILVDHGVTAQLSVSGCGVSHWERIEPDAAYKLGNGRSFRFLHVSSCFPRKGADVLLKAYGGSFSNIDDVTLVIKTFDNPHNEIEKGLAEAKNNRSDFPDVLIIKDDLSDAQLKALYEQCDALIAPSRAEGFGLPLAEAMLSGLPVITTGWGGQLEFCNHETAWLIDYSFTYARTHFGLFDSVWAEPDADQLACLMRDVYALPANERHARARRGRDLLLRRFAWTDVAERLVAAARSWAQTPPAPSPYIGWVTSWNARCGIATYSEHLITNMPADICILASHTDSPIEPDGGNVRRCWHQGEADDLEELNRTIDTQGINTLVVQFNYGFFNFNHFANFLDKQTSAGRKVVVMLHSTKDQAFWGDSKPLARLRPSLARCARLLVHAASDLNRLKDIGLVENATLFPHGGLDYAPAAKKAGAGFLIASYGFFLPPKGLLELIDAVGLLRGEGMNVRLRMVNAAYPIPESSALIETAKKRIMEKELEPHIELTSDYLADEESLSLLSDADLIVFPTQTTAESASGAVRYGLVSGRPVAVTPLPIFDDVASAVFRLPGATVENIAKGIAKIAYAIQNGTLEAQRIAEQADRWRAAHRYSDLGPRLHGMLVALNQADADGSRSNLWLANEHNVADIPRKTGRTKSRQGASAMSESARSTPSHRFPLTPS